MGKRTHKHYVVRKGRGYWLPTPKMKKAGFQNVACGLDGPEAWRIAEEWEQRWQAHRKGAGGKPARLWPIDSVGDAFERFRRSETWKAKKPRTREEWERFWKYIGPIFGDRHPARITFAHLDEWYHRIKGKHGVDIAYKAMKIWRALYTVMASMKLVTVGADPSASVIRTTPAPRTSIWSEGEAVRLVKAAWRGGFRGLACCIAVAWDTSCSPGDVRELCPLHAIKIGDGWGFLLQRAKTGEDVLGTLSPHTRLMVEAYVAELGALLLPNVPIFRSRGYAGGPKGGRPRAGAVYTRTSLGNDFRIIRAEVFGKAENRKLMDMRRSGAIETTVGGGSVEVLAAKMANSINQSRTLQKTYLPVNFAAVLQADEARRRGRRILGGEQTGYKKLKLLGGES